MEPEEHRETHLGEIEFDDSEAANFSVTVCLNEAGSISFRRGLYVTIHDREQQTDFLGRVVDGPFYGVPRNGSVNGSGRPSATKGVIELMGELIEGTRLRPTATRPRPGSQIFPFTGERLRQLLGVEGDFYIGRLIGADAVSVHLKSDSKNFLPRNVGIFGTVGSGKSNTMQVLMEEAVRAGWAVIVIDVEGEYVQMNQQTDDAAMVRLLQHDHCTEPQGIRDFHVYVPASGISKTGSSTPFKVPISALESEIVADILQFSEAHYRMFEAACRNAASRNEYLTRLPARAESSPVRAPIDRTPARMPDRASALLGQPPRFVTLTNELEDEPASAQRVYTLQDLIDGLQESNQSVPLIPRIRSEDLPSAASLRARLVHLGRSDVLDWNATAHIPELPLNDMLRGGRLSVVDVSETDDRSRNIAIAYTLQALFDLVIQTPAGEPMENGIPRPPVLVVIEEVHSFVSRATAARMRAVLDRLQVISRRGRKRWMALALVSQQPNHVPDELFELANTRFIHQMKSATNMAAVKSTTGGVHDALWSAVTTLGPGQCLLSSSVLSNAMLVNVRPAQSRRMLSR